MSPCESSLFKSDEGRVMKQFKQHGLKLLLTALVAFNVNSCSAIEQQLGVTANFVEYDGMAGFFVINNSASPLQALQQYSFQIAGNSDDDDTMKPRVYAPGVAPFPQGWSYPQAQINGVTISDGVNSKPLINPNPFYGAQITGAHFTPGAGLFLTFNNPQLAAAPSLVADGNNKQICLLRSLGNSDPAGQGYNYVSMLMNTIPIRDANVVPPSASNIASIFAFEPGGSQGGYVFAAVSFDAMDNPESAGIAVLQVVGQAPQVKNQPTPAPANLSLMPLNVTGGTLPIDGGTGDQANNCAQALNTTAILGSSVARISSVNSMHWSQTLNCLFIGVTIGTPASNHEQIGLLIARMDGNNQLTIQPAVPLGQGVLATQTPVGITSSTPGFGVLRVKTMVTSTALAYAIVQNTENNNSVYAVPLVYSANGATLGNSVGFVSSSSNSTQVVTSGTMTNNATRGAVIGGGAVCGVDSTITDMKVVGDTVYVSVARNDGQPNAQAGVYLSQALFDQNGRITGWTSWVRMYGAQARTVTSGAQTEINSIDSAWGFWANDMVGTYWQWTGEPSNQYIKGLEWQGVAQANSAVAAINAAVPTTTIKGNSVNPILNAYSYDISSTGFSGDTIPSLIVGLGINSVVFAQTGQSNAIGNLLPASQLNFPPGNICVRTDAVLSTISSLCAGDISRKDKNAGWYLVGGYGGLAVLSQADGTGWWSPGLSNQLAYLKADTTTFKQLRPSNQPAGINFVDVVDITSDDNNFYVVDRNGLYQIPYNAAAFTATSPAALNETLLYSTQAQGAYPTTVRVINNVILLGTTNGLVWKVMGDPQWTTFDVGFNVVRQLDFKQDAAAQGRGNVYLLSINDNDTAYTYRLLVDSSVSSHGQIVQLVQESGQSQGNGSSISNPYYFAYGRIKAQVFNNGSYLFALRSFNGYRNNQGAIPPLLDRFVMNAALQYRRASAAVELGNNPATEYSIGTFLQDFATGAFMVSGPWGLKSYDATTQPVPQPVQGA